MPFGPDSIGGTTADSRLAEALDHWARRAAAFHQRHRRALHGSLIVGLVGFSAVAFGVAPLAPDAAEARIPAGEALMPPVLTMTCLCGRFISAPCPTLAYLPSALAMLTGWGWDHRGFVRCPECIKASAVAAEPAQGRLF